MPERKTLTARKRKRTLLLPLVILLKKSDERRITRVITEHISKVIILGINGPCKKTAFRQAKCLFRNAVLSSYIIILVRYKYK